MVKQKYYFFFLIATIFGCSQESNNPLFEEVSTESGAVFINQLEYTEEFNPYTYRNFYNGAGVALGDINNDGLLDIYFTGNIVDNKLYLNEGNWKFRDITDEAGVACSNIWSSGATFVDINGDDLLDIYVCKSGKPGGEKRFNELFINNGDNTFTESAQAYGLDVVGLSTQAAFFDFDLDGDLDCYLLTNSIRSVGTGYDLIVDQRETPDPQGGGNKFFRNDDGTFVDVSTDVGIYSSVIGFGLGITISDFNGDLYPDVFISNDFFERDYLYINNEGESFTESVESYFQSISMGSMGADIADLDNDLLPDLMVTEMLPATQERKKSKTVYESWDKYALAVDKGYYHQFPRNALQRNIGNNKFVEVGRQAGIAATEWSWGSLIFDMDNDGLKDIFVANGITKDLLDRDYLTYMANETKVRQMLQNKGAVIKELIDIMPSNPVSNFAFRNLGDFRFEEAASQFNLDQPSFSNGSAYGDLDNDGDLDLVVNNINMQSFVYRNTTDTARSRSLRIQLKQSGANTYAIGATILAYVKGKTFKVENYPSRGFESSIDPTLHIGLGNTSKLDSVLIYWPDQTVQKLTEVQSNQKLTIEKNSGLIKSHGTALRKTYLVASAVKVPFTHLENVFVDFDRDRLLPQMYHNEGPSISVARIDGDNQDDLYIGGAKTYPGKLFLQRSQGFMAGDSAAFIQNSVSEDTDNLFFDCDGDGDMDLYVASGGRAFSTSSSALLDRLYINDGAGNFTLGEGRLPFTTYFSTAVVVNYDFDKDGDQDLFVGERFNPFFYGTKVNGYLLENDGNGYFQDRTQELCPGMQGMDMITDAIWVDYDNDTLMDLVVSTDWGPLYLFRNEGGTFMNASAASGLEPYTGWWNTLVAIDYDGDGDTDIIAGNHGLNSFFKENTRLFVSDFDLNGSKDYIMCLRINDNYYPIVDRNELIAQLPALKKKVLYFKDYANMRIEDLFSPEELQSAEIFEAATMASSIFINEGGKFTIKRLPEPLQYAPIHVIEKADINQDGVPDLLFGGNQYLVKPQFGRYDAMPLSIVLGGSKEIKGSDVILTSIFGQIRDIKTIEVDNNKVIVVGFNNGPVGTYEVNK